MKNLGKLLATIVILALLVTVITNWISYYFGGSYYKNGSVFSSILMWLIPIGAIGLSLILLRALYKRPNSQKITILFLALSLAATSACNYAHSNVQTLVTEDCGVNWRLIKAGSTVPMGTANPCFRKVAIPDYPMQGDARFRSNFKGNVKADVDLSYNYRITDGIKFMSEAKYIGSQKDGEDEAANNTRFEGAENSVIDRHIRDVQRDLLVHEDIVDFDAPAFEEKLIAPVNARLAERGVQIDFLSFVPNPDTLTGDAIDVATALRIYRNNQIPDEVAYRIIEAKSGAARIGSLEPQPTPEPKK